MTVEELMEKLEERDSGLLVLCRTAEELLQISHVEDCGEDGGTPSAVVIVLEATAETRR